MNMSDFDHGKDVACHSGFHGAASLRAHISCVMDFVAARFFSHLLWLIYVLKILGEKISREEKASKFCSGQLASCCSFLFL